MTTLAFLVAAAIGAPARYVIDRRVQDRHPGRFPWGTLVVNASGCFLLGIVAGLGRYHGLSTAVTTALGTGGLGAYTTFSTFAVDTAQLIERGDVETAARNIGGNVGLSLFAAAIGLAITAAL